MNIKDLHEYQKRLANFIAQHPKCIISVDMGLGKTAAVLAWLDWYARKRDYNVRALIVAPKRVAENNWLQEAQKWGLRELSEKMIIVAGTPKKRHSRLNDDTKPIKIISRDNCNDFATMSTDVLILDELTSYKQTNAVRSRAVRSVKAQVRIGLTGTFLANGAIDIYGQALACGLSMGENFYAWRATYFKDVLKGAGLAFQKWKLTVPLAQVLNPIKDNIFTLTAEDYLEIPDVTETTHEVALDEETSKAIEELDAFLATKVGGEVLTFSEQQKFAKLQTLCNGFVYRDVTIDYEERGELKHIEETLVVRTERSAKLEEVADFVADCRDQGEQVLLFYAFREEEKWLTELLDSRGVNVTSARDKDFMQEWNDGTTDCLMAHPASAGHGLNLQYGGRIIVWSTLTYNYELFAQGNARLARQGQRKNVQIHYFVAKNTCEEKAVMALKKKQGEQTDFLNLTKR